MIYHLLSYNAKYTPVITGLWARRGSVAPESFLIPAEEYAAIPQDDPVRRELRPFDFRAENFAAQFNRPGKEPDVFVFHFFRQQWVPIVNALAADPGNVLAWFSWGPDINFYRKDRLGPRTLSCELRRDNVITGALRRLARAGLGVRDRLRRKAYMNAVMKFDFCATVTPGEYLDFCDYAAGKFKAEYLDFTYGDLGFFMGECYREEAKAAGCDVLVGHSAFRELNHLDVFERLAAVDFHGNVVLPLSYGAKPYAGKVAAGAEALWPGRMMAIRDFLPTGEYVKVLSGCGAMVIGAVNQCAMGNIIMALWLGIKVFMPERNSAFRMFRERGFRIFSMDELGSEPLDRPLGAGELAVNRKLLADYYSPDAIAAKTEHAAARLMQYRKNESPK